mgnify:CR=1 FL=1
MIQINSENCTGCLRCVNICPRGVLVAEKNSGKTIPAVSAIREDLCLECGHCTAICGENALQINMLNPEKFLPLNGSDITSDQVLALLKQRRSVRRYKNQEIPIKLLRQIIQACDCAPTGSGRPTTSVIIISSKNILRELSGHIYDFYEKLEKGLSNPVIRFFMKKRMGQNKLATLRDFVMPGMHWFIKWYRSGRNNEILRDCPVLMLFLSPVNEPVGSENCLITAFHAILMAQTLDVGTCFNDLIPPACNRTKEIRQLLEIPEDREVYAAVTLGLPKYRFKSVPPRKLYTVKHFYREAS